MQTANTHHVEHMPPTNLGVQFKVFLQMLVEVSRYNESKVHGDMMDDVDDEIEGEVEDATNDNSFVEERLEPGQANSAQPAIKQQGWKNPNCLTPKWHEKGGRYHEGWYASVVPLVQGPMARDPTPVQLVDPEQWADQALMLVQMAVDHQELELEMIEERALVMLPPPEH
ncbi:hypothetical protein JHK86_004672 [Glycine max]|nr:hypothetical protein JHK86_004672 [Glycine max]